MMHRIRIGNQTSKSASPLILPFEYALEKGFDAFEWFPDRDPSGTGWEESDLSAETRDWIRRVGRERDIRFSLHAPLWVDPFRGGATGRLDESIRLLEDIGADLLNIHCPPREILQDAPKLLKALLQRLHGDGVQLSLENTPSDSPEDVNALFALLGEADLPIHRIGFCLDLGHANLCGATRNDFIGYLCRIGERVPLIHVHAHENDGDADSHLPLFSGAARKDEGGMRGFAEWLRRRHFSGSIILEQWPSPPDLLDQARSRLKEMLTPSAHNR